MSRIKKALERVMRKRADMYRELARIQKLKKLLRPRSKKEKPPAGPTTGQGKEG